MATQTDTDFDVDDYRERSADLVDSIDETTALVSEMADSMERLSVACEGFKASSGGRAVATDGGRPTRE